MGIDQLANLAIEPHTGLQNKESDNCAHSDQGIRCLHEQNTDIKLINECIAMTLTSLTGYPCSSVYKSHGWISYGAAQMSNIGKEVSNIAV